jgi:3-hydroxyacyl-CoA dehydrogenase
MKRSIKKVAVLGSGVMGSRIACLFAGIGVQVLLLDIVPKDVAASAPASQKNKLVNDALQAAIKSNPSPVYTNDVVKNITTGNFDDNMKDIALCDWIIEVVVERLDIKQKIYEQVEQFRKPGTLITTNTSGIPIHILSEGRSEDFKKHFCGTHFFNPPRYLRLLEIIPAPETDKEVINFLMHYGDVFLGKTTVLAKDTPAFIANRIGVFALIAVINIYQKYGLTINDVDQLTGPLIGNPKSAVFRTSDVVGIDTFIEVAKGIVKNCPDDEAHELLTVPASMLKMLENKMLGDKTGGGFFKKIKLPLTEGSPEERKKDTEIEMLDLNTLQYVPRNKTKFASVAAVQGIDDLKMRFKILLSGNDNAAAFLRNMHYALFSYVTHRIPEISDELFRLDDAIKAGFGWELGTFEKWDVLGVEKTVADMKQHGYKVAPWVDEMLAAGNKSFYKKENSKVYYYDIRSKTYEPEPSAGNFIILENYSDQIVWKNSNAWLYDIGDDVVALQWNTKMNTIGSEVIQAINKSIDVAEDKFKGLVIANSSANFSAGANVGMIFMFAVEQEYDDLDMAIRVFQNAMMRVRYSSIPVVVAPHGLTLGGGCEMNLHADKIHAAAETYIGLVELGVGLIPGGGGTKEFALRAADEMHEDEPETITLKNRFLTIATAKVATSAFEGYNMGILRKGHDEVVMNPQRRIGEAKNAVIEMYDNGYVQPVQRKDIKVLGRSALGALYAGINGMWRANYATEHDALVARKLAYVMCGGDLSEQTFVSEQYLLDLEREAFLSLCGQRKTLERIEAVIKKGKPVRN